MRKRIGHIDPDRASDVVWPLRNGTTQSGSPPSVLRKRNKSCGGGDGARHPHAFICWKRSASSRSGRGNMGGVEPNLDSCTALWKKGEASEARWCSICGSPSQIEDGESTFCRRSSSVGFPPLLSRAQDTGISHPTGCCLSTLMWLGYGGHCRCRCCRRCRRLSVVKRHAVGLRRHVTMLV